MIANLPSTYQIGATFRRLNYRITYHPDWDANRPWVSYYGGTAGAHFLTPEHAQRTFGITWDTFKP